MKKASIAILTILAISVYGQIRIANGNKVGNLEPSGKGQLEQNGARTGLWEFYDVYNKIEFKFDYTLNKLIYEKSLLDTSTYRIIVKGNYIKASLEQPPLYKEGSKSIAKLIGKNIKYPRNAANNGIQGKVFVGLLIDSIGNCIDKRIVVSVDSSCDNEALRVTKLIPNNWYAAQYKGRKVTTEQLIPINFKLE